MQSSFTVLSALLLMLALTAAVSAEQQRPCIPRSQGEKTSDGLYLQQRVVTNTRNESLWLVPNPSAFVKSASALRTRRFFKTMLTLIEQRDTMSTLERTPIVITVSVLLDALIGDICSYMQTELDLPELDCNSTQQIMVLKSQLDIIETSINLYDELNFGAEELGLDDEGEVDGRYKSWQENVRTPCLADDECDVGVADSLYEEELSGSLYGGGECTTESED